MTTALVTIRRTQDADATAAAKPAIATISDTAIGAYVRVACRRHRDAGRQYLEQAIQTYREAAEAKGDSQTITFWA